MHPMAPGMMRGDGRVCETHACCHHMLPSHSQIFDLAASTPLFLSDLQVKFWVGHPSKSSVNTHSIHSDTLCTNSFDKWHLFSFHDGAWHPEISMVDSIESRSGQGQRPSPAHLNPAAPLCSCECPISSGASSRHHCYPPGHINACLVTAL